MEEQAQTPTEVQGQAAEGSGSEGGSFYDSYLNSEVPEDYRSHVEPYLRQVERNTNEKFREFAEYRKQWEPYKEMGLTEYEPEDVQALLQFAEAINDPDTFKDWWESTGKEQGWYGEEPAGGEEPSEGEYDEGDVDSIRDAVEQLLEERLSPLMEREQQRAQEEAVSKASEQIDQEIAALKEKHGDFDEQAVYRFALAYDGPDAIERGLKDYQDLIARTEQGVVTQRDGIPAAGEGEGRPNTATKPITDFDEAGVLAKERLRKSIAA